VAEPLVESTVAGSALTAKAGEQIYAVGEHHWASLSPQRGRTLKIFDDLPACQAALPNGPPPRLVMIDVCGQTDRVVDFVYQVRSDSALANTQLLLLAEEQQLVELMPLFRGVADIDFAVAASSSELLRQRIGHLLAMPAQHADHENSPVRLQVVDSVMSRLINSRRRSQQELNRVQQMLDLTAGAVAMFDLQTLKWVYGNRQAIALFLPTDAQNRPEIILTELLACFAPEALADQLERLRSGRESWCAIETLALAHGAGVAQLAQLHFLTDQCSEGVFVLSTHDVAVAHDAELPHHALHDLLTGLPNRKMLLDQVAKAIGGVKAQGGSFGLMVMDLDQFKDVNDSFGHVGGDSLLCQVGQLLSATAGENDLVARLGDDDFAVLFSLPQNRQAVWHKVDQIAQALQRQFIIEDRKLEIGASMGVVHYPTDGEDEQTLLRHAEIASFLAKRDGLGIVAFEQQQEQTNHDQLTLKADLRQAINGGELFIHYQPKVRISDRRCVGVEALTRWVHPTRGFIPPDEFIALAERAGLIKNLTRWVIAQAVEQAARWREAGNPLCVAVNLSARNLQEPDLVAFVKDKLAEFLLPPSALQFEITESDIMADPAKAIAMIEELHGFGIEFAVDDFGTGYSSLAYLKKLRISELKIDKGFISQLNSAGDDMVIVHSTITMAHQLGIRVVAEGVEDQEIWDLLDVLECDVVQGYLISRPVSPKDLDASLAKGLTSHIN